MKKSDLNNTATDAKRRSLWSMLSLAAALIACYGTLAVVALFSVLGISLVVNESVWAGAIIAFALLTTGVIALGMHKHRSTLPMVLAVIGAVILVYTMYVNYSLLTEVIGFGFLAVATYFDFKLRR